ncbi:hypothetical protein LE181_18235 [Streptomyces sp. SCA3-4]|uniref:hypothetical protein n=1 Tax=Streptomyces sichuanensis TaxID=2871810 RepID=UPI001CE3709D|nr:hypothetical protein [Streptomyces sichuanensis]MCA6094093.1 hypothetical protein [Streptomyces sichuanensis]
MSDLYELQLAWELGDALPGEVLDDLRWHLGLLQDIGPLGDDVDECGPLLAARGPASRIGGFLSGELTQGQRGWSVTLRQEVHAEELPELDELLNGVAPYAPESGPVGHLRFHEDEVPDLLAVQSGVVVRQPLHPAGSELVPFLEGLA